MLNVCNHSPSSPPFPECCRGLIDDCLRFDAYFTGSTDAVGPEFDLISKSMVNESSDMMGTLSSIEKTH